MKGKHAGDCALSAGRSFEHCLPEEESKWKSSLELVVLWEKR